MAKKKKRTKHMPQRTCVGCRSVESKRSLMRIVRTPDGVFVDPTGKLAGRGAYLHENRACWEQGLRGSLSHALKVKLTPEDEARLRDHMEAIVEETT